MNIHSLAEKIRKYFDEVEYGNNPGTTLEKLITEELNPDFVAASHEDQSTQSFPFIPSHFANWYARHGIPLGIGRENARVIYEAAVEEHRQSVIDTTIAHNDILERIEMAFAVLYDKWLSAGHRCDMNDAMELMARELGKPICPDCKCELVYPGNTCSQCNRPPEGMTDNIIHSARMWIPGA